MSFYKFFEDKIKNKSIVILGLGKEGISNLNLLLKTGGFKNLGIADQKKQSLENLPFLSDNLAVKTHFEKGYQDRLNDYDLILKAPGVVLDPSVDPDKITSAMELFCEYYRNRIIGITGTKGKSTSVSLLFHILTVNNVKAVLAGNIGIPVFDILDDIEKDSTIILEMSCHQLEYMRVSPGTGILLNLHEEHLDHYGSYDSYCKAKYNIFKHMTEGSKLIATSDIGNKQMPEGVEVELVGYSDKRKEKRISVNEKGFYFNGKWFPVPDDLPLLGIHNIYNLACIYPVASDFRISFDDFIKAVYSFRPLPHRLEFVGNHKGIDFYDDSISTMGNSTINAVISVKNCSSVLIGGMDRGIDYSDLIGFIIKNPQYTYILMEASGERIHSRLKEGNNLGSNIVLVPHLEAAVKEAFNRTPKGKACILSPAAASYGIFRNFEHRGEVFQNLISMEKK